MCSSWMGVSLAQRTGKVSALVLHPGLWSEGCENRSQLLQEREEVVLSRWDFKVATYRLKGSTQSKLLLHKFHSIIPIKISRDLRGTGDRRRRGQPRMRWLDGITDSWTWVWGNSRRWRWTGRPGVLRFMGSQRVGHDWATELNLCLYTSYQSN